MPNNYPVVGEFITKNGVDAKLSDTLNGLIDFMKEKGQYIESGDLKKQFIEKTTVLDKNKVPIEISSCSVCGQESFEVKKEP